ncbi:hypothetical protein GCM10007856_04060 [Azospirillum oryzae]|nr:hypothetical protein GCM10007856_04060 [Azospirillum oryzae]
MRIPGYAIARRPRMRLVDCEAVSGKLGVECGSESVKWGVRQATVQIPMKPAGYSDLKAATVPN